jgi:prophage DNA circulation protein
MAGPTYAATPQAFSWQGRLLQGYLLSFSGSSPRRVAAHEFLKRDGARQEDMGRGPRRLEVQLIFTGPTCAKDAAEFSTAAHADPVGSLVHPTAGQWLSFCTGPQYEVDFARAIDEIRLRVAFVETQTDAAVTAAIDTPNVASAAQQATSALAKVDSALATFAGALALARAQAAVGQAMGAVDRVLDAVDTLAAPLDTVRGMLASIVGEASSVMGAIEGIAAQWNALSQDAQAYVDAASDVFSGDDTAAGSAAQADSLLGTAEASALALEASLLASTPTAAGAADAVGAVEEALAACFVLADALAAARPPTILYTVPALVDVMTLAQQRYGATTARARASDILGLNRIPNPAAIPAGTQLLIPSR